MLLVSNPRALFKPRLEFDTIWKRERNEPKHREWIECNVIKEHWFGNILIYKYQIRIKTYLDIKGEL